MSCAQNLKDLLAPLAVYSWDQSFQWAELISQGESLDTCLQELEEMQREMSLCTAQEYGLRQIAALLSKKPLANEPVKLRQALAALLRIGDRTFTIEAIRDNLSGCGITATVAETETPGKVAIAFPFVGGIPENFAELKGIMEQIVPCHLEIDYQFRFLLWFELEQKILTWRMLEQQDFTWKELERFVVL